MPDARSWSVEVKTSAEQFVEKLGKGDRKTAVRIVQAIVDLEFDPFPPGHKKLKGSSNEFRVRVSSYRILYTVDAKTRTVTVYDVERRDKAYK